MKLEATSLLPRLVLACLVLAAGAALGPVAAAAPLELPATFGEPGPTRLFAHGEDLLVTRGRAVELYDAETLEALFTDASLAGDVVPLPVGSREQFFYFRYAPERELVGLRGNEATLLSQRPDLLTAPTPGGGLLFAARSYGTASQEIFLSDGSVAGTQRLFVVSPAYPCVLPPACPPVAAYPRFLEMSAGGRIFYLGYYANAFTASSYLWTLDPPSPGTPAPAVREVDFLTPGTSSRQLMPDGRLLFTIAAYPHLYLSDGDEIRRIFDFSELGAGGAYGLREIGGLLYFLADRAGGRELWRSDGTTEGTFVVRAFGPGPPIAEIFEHGGRLYLPVDAEGRGEELWTSDGTAAGTRLAFEIGPGAAGSQPRALTPLADGRFLIALDDGVHGSEPWISDGTAAGTFLVADARPGPLGSDPRDMVVAGGKLFFVGESPQGRVAQYVAAPPPLATCPADRLCLLGGRFEVETFFTTADGSGKGERKVASDQSGIFSFFSPDNWEVMVKVLDGCAINDRFWVFASAATDVRYELRIKDRDSGQVKSYFHGGGGPAPAITDIEAFATCPAD